MSPEEILSKMTELAERTAPVVLDTTVAAVQYSGINDLVSGLGWAIVAVSTGFGLRHCLKKVTLGENSFDGEMFYFTASLALGLCCLVSSVVSLACFLDVWNYVAIFDPGAYVVKKVLKL